MEREKALLCLLFLRGPQTAGELKSRSERLYSFADLDEVNLSLQSLLEGEFVVKLDRQPGQKESRYAHLLSGEPPESKKTEENEEQRGGKVIVRRENKHVENDLREQVAQLQKEISDLKAEFHAFKNQFE